MKEFEGKTLEECLEKASQELNVGVDSLKYEIVEESKSLFSKRTVIHTFDLEDVVEYAKKYVLDVIESLGLNATCSSKMTEDIIHLDLSAEEDASRIIGRGGETLKALNELVRGAVSNKFGEFYRILLNINDYKDKKYEKLIERARRIARDVKNTRVTAELDPMPSDERRVIHNALSNDVHLKTLSVGTGKNRHVTIQYVNYVPSYSKTTEEVVNEEQKDN